MSENINPINSYSFSMSLGCSTDPEHKRIMRKLYEYGIRPTGNKSTDFRILREIELREAQKENTVSSKFLTVSRMEQERIQEKKKEKRIENDPRSHPESAKGQKILGEQILLAIKMKKEEEDRQKKKLDDKKRGKI